MTLEPKIIAKKIPENNVIKNKISNSKNNFFLFFEKSKFK